MEISSFQQAQRLGALLTRQKATVTTAESCTGGGVAQVITDVTGASNWFGGGWVTYSNRCKQQWLGVDEADLQRVGAVSREVVCAMAAGAAERAEADYAVAVSGIAGPGGGSAEKPVGTVWFAWRLPDGRVEAEQMLFDGNRAEIRASAVTAALAGLVRAASHFSV